MFPWPCCFWDSRISNLPRRGASPGPSRSSCATQDKRNLLEGRLMQELVDSRCCGSRRNPISSALIRAPTEPSCSPASSHYFQTDHSCRGTREPTHPRRCPFRFDTPSTPNSFDDALEHAPATGNIQLEEDSVTRNKRGCEVVHRIDRARIKVSAACNGAHWNVSHVPCRE